MDPDYLAYFGQRSEQLLSGVPAAWDLRLESRQVGPSRLMARVAVDAARQELPQVGVLRPDAEVLLYSIAYELVARPVLTIEPSMQEQLAADVAADARTIARAANTADNGDISSHALVDGLSRSWDELRMANWRFWDRHR